MNKTKKIILLIVGTILVVISLWYFYKKSSKTKIPQKTVYPVTVPKISSNFEGGAPTYSFNLDFEKVIIPETLPFITIGLSKTISEDKVIEMAKNAGFNNVSSKITNGGGKRLFFFKDKTSDLIIYADTGEISYRTAFRTHKNKNLNSDSIIDIAKEFLVEKFSFNKDLLQSPFITYLSTESELTKVTDYKNATMYKVSFSPIQTTYKVLTLNPKESSINVWVVPDGTIAKADIKFFENAGFSKDKYKIKNTDSIKNTINKATIIQVNDINGSSLNVRTKDIKKVEINKIEIVYVADSYNSKSFQPFFLLEGTSIITEYPNPLNTILYLSAIE